MTCVMYVCVYTHVYTHTRYTHVYTHTHAHIYIYIYMYTQGGADKSLVWPGRKQATATKLRIYSTYSPRSSVHFLAHCSNFCKTLKKNSEGGSNDLHVGQKMVTFQLFFQSREQVVVQRGQIWRIGWVIKTLEAQVGQFLLGCKCPVSWGIFM